MWKSAGRLRLHTSSLRSYSAHRPDIRTSQPKPRPTTNLKDLREPFSAVSELYQGVSVNIHQARPAAKITKLDNGIRVASLEWDSLSAGVGVAINVGSRYEQESEYGAAFFCEKLAFSSGMKHSQKKNVEQLEKHGTNITTVTNREQIIINTEGIRSDIPLVLDMLADSLFSPRFVEEEFELQKYALNEAFFSFLIDPELWLPEHCFAPAFGERSSLGRRPHDFKYLESVTLESVKQFHKKWFTPSRVVIGALGVNHDRIVEQVHNLLGHLPQDNVPVNENANLTTPYYPAPPAAEYTGGLLALEDDRESKFGEMLPESFNYYSAAFTGFKAPSIMSDRDYYITSTLATLLGNGSSFSSGGPGKGMYSRVYRDMLSNGYVQSGTNVYQPLQDVGLFGLMLTGHSKYLPHLQSMSIEGLLRLFSIEDEEFMRAKNQLKALVFNNLESTHSTLDDMLRQVSYYNTRNDFDYHVSLIDSITKDELHKTLAQIFSSPPSILTYGLKPIQPVAYSRCLDFIKTNLKAINV